MGVVSMDAHEKPKSGSLREPAWPEPWHFSFGSIGQIRDALVTLRADEKLLLPRSESG